MDQSTSAAPKKPYESASLNHTQKYITPIDDASKSEYLHSTRFASPSGRGPPSATGSDYTPPENTNGRMFFQNVRQRLTGDDFNDFLSNIKKLNSKQQTKQQALENAKMIFGADNYDLFKEFESILSPKICL